MPDQPFYEASLSCLDCHFNFLINNIPVLSFSKGANINTELAINSFLKPGTNQLTCEIKPLKGQAAISEKAFVKISILEQLPESDKSIQKESFQTPSFKITEKNPAMPSFRLEGAIASSISFTSVLFSGIPLNPGVELKSELFKQYEKIWLWFKSKDVRSVMEACTLRNTEYALLMNLSKEELEQEIERDYQGYLNDATMKLWEFSMDKVSLQLHQNGRLATLQLENGKQPLCFYNKEDAIAIYIPFYFFRNPQSLKLEIVR